MGDCVLFTIQLVKRFRYQLFAAFCFLFFVISFCYILFWGPLFTVTLANWSWEWKDAKNSLSHEVG